MRLASYHYFAGAGAGAFAPAAARMTFPTSAGCDSITTWLDLMEVIVAFARFAIAG